MVVLASETDTLPHSFSLRVKGVKVKCLQRPLAAAVIVVLFRTEHSQVYVFHCMLMCPAGNCMALSLKMCVRMCVDGGCGRCVYVLTGFVRSLK